jgi:hypothetical protein
MRNSEDIDDYVQENSVNLVECQAYDLLVDVTRQGNNPPAQGPFYFMAYPANGVPTVTPLGSDLTRMKWTVNFPSGAC